MSSPTPSEPRPSRRGKRAADRPASRWRRSAGREEGGAAPTPEEPVSEQVSPEAEGPEGEGTAPAPVESAPVESAAVASVPLAPAVKAAGRRGVWVGAWLAVLVLGAVALGLSAVAGALDQDGRIAGIGPIPFWLDSAGAVAVATATSWLLATRTAGRPLIAAGLALVLGLASVIVGGEILPTGAAVLMCVVGGVYAVMATVPAVTWLAAMREALVATLITAITAFAALGFAPTLTRERFNLVALALALALVLAIVWRLGAGLHGLGRRGIVVVAIGIAVLVVTIAYAELLRRYGAQSFVARVLDFADWTSDRIGAFPRPIVVLLGIPALVWGTHLRARRRQGWWVCAFGVAATVPLASGLVAPDSSYLEAGLRTVYSVVLGLVLGFVVIRADVALTGPKGSRGRRAEEAGAHRPEPSRFAPL